jgi:hypothetical protein
MYIRTGMVGKAHCGEQAGKVWIPIDVVLAVARWSTSDGHVQFYTLSLKVSSAQYYTYYIYIL